MSQVISWTPDKQSLILQSKFHGRSGGAGLALFSVQQIFWSSLFEAHSKNAHKLNLLRYAQLQQHTAENSLFKDSPISAGNYLKRRWLLSRYSWVSIVSSVNLVVSLLCAIASSLLWVTSSSGSLLSALILHRDQLMSIKAANLDDGLLKHEYFRSSARFNQLAWAEGQHLTKVWHRNISNLRIDWKLNDWWMHCQMQMVLRVREKIMIYLQAVIDGSVTCRG